MKRILTTAAAMTLALAMSGAAYAGEKPSHSQTQRDMHTNSRSRFDDHKRYDHRRYGEPGYCEPVCCEPVCCEPVCCEPVCCEPAFCETCECGPFCNEFPWRYHRDRYDHSRRDHDRERTSTMKSHSRGTVSYTH